MDQRKLIPGNKYIIRHKYKTGWSSRTEDFEATLVTKNVSGWHMFKIVKPVKASTAADSQINKNVSIASRSVISSAGPQIATPKKKLRGDKDTKKELEALVLMLANFKIVAGVNSEGTGIVIDMEEIPRFRRLLTRMFGTQLGVDP